MLQRILFSLRMKGFVFKNLWCRVGGKVKHENLASNKLTTGSNCRRKKRELKKCTTATATAQINGLIGLLRKKIRAVCAARLLMQFFDLV